MRSGFSERLVKARRESGIPFRKGGPGGFKSQPQGLGTLGQSDMWVEDASSKQRESELGTLREPRVANLRGCT